MTSRRLTALIVLVASFCAKEVAAETPIRVGVYNFPPEAEVAASGQTGGLVTDLIAALNTRQTAFHFVPVVTSSLRRYIDFSDHRYDVIFFEDMSWGWSGAEVEATRPLLADTEVYVALRKPGRDQSFFDDLSKRRLVAMLGYHYQFANGDISEPSLRKHFNIELSHSHRRNLELILADRPSVAEVTVVSRAFLATYLTQHPDSRDKLLVSDHPDQSYQLRALLQPAGVIDARTLETLLQPMIEDGSYRRMVEQHHLQLPEGGLFNP